MNSKLDIIDEYDFPKEEGNGACRSCTAKRSFLYKVFRLGGKTAVGLGAGLTVGIGALAAAAIGEVAIPAILTFKVLGLTGGALGFLSGAKDLRK